MEPPVIIASTQLCEADEQRVESGKLTIWQSYLLPIVATACTLAFRLAIDGPVGGQPTFVIFTLPIMLCAYVGGLRAGLLATALSYFAASYFLLPPLYSFAVESPAERFQQLFVVLAGVLISVLSETLHRARQQADMAVREHKDAVSAVQESEIRLGGIVNSAMDAIITIDSNHRIILFNPAAERVFGYTSAQMLGQPIDQLVPERFRATHGHHIHTFAETGITSRSMGGLGAITGRHASGREIDIEASISQVDIGGQKLFTVILRDITAIKRAREEQERFFTLSLDMLCILDTEGHFLRSNPAFEKVLGFPLDELKGQSALDYLHPDDLASSQEALSGLAEGRPIVDYVNRFRCQDGSYKSILWAAAPYGDRYYAAGRDITERVSAEMALRESEETFSAAFRSGSLALVIADKSGKIVEANPAFCDLIGYTHEEIIGRTAVELEILTAETRKELLAAMSTADGAVDNLEIQFRVRDGSVRYVLYSITTVMLHGVEHRLSSGLDITKRKQAEEELAESQRFLQSTLDALASHIAVLDETGTIIAVNKAWRAFSEANDGIGTFCSVGANYLAVCQAATGDCAEEALTVSEGIQAIMAGMQDEFSLEYPCHSPDEKRWFNLSVTRFVGEGPTRIVVAHENVTSRRLAEDTLRKIEEQLRIVTENARVGLVTVNSERRYTFANSAYVEMLGLPSPHIVGLALADVLGDLYQNQVQSRLDSAFAGERVAYELHRRAGDEDYYYAVRYEPLKMDGEIPLVVVVITDITELKQVETALQRARNELESRVEERTTELKNANESLRVEIIERQMVMSGLRETAEALAATQKMLQLVMDHIPQAIFWKDLKSQFLGCNYRLAQHAGYETPEELIGKTDYEMPWADFAADFQKDDRLVMETGRPKLNIEESFVRADGSNAWLRTNKIPLHDSENRVMGVLCSYEDISDQKLAEVAITLAKKEAEAANLAKSEFLSRMSHELRTPLNAILGFGQILEMQELPPKSHRNVEHILKAGAHLLQLINEVLDISRIDAGALSLSLEPVPVGTAVREVLDLVRPLAASTEIQLIDKLLPGHESHVLADRLRIKQVILNLFSNAIKYNRKSGRVTVRGEELTEKQLFRLSIEDNGWGVREEDIEKLFIPFERLGAAQTRIEGTGIGLSLTKRLIEAMGGTIGVTSTLDQGSTFWIDLPLVASPLQMAATEEDALLPIHLEVPAGQQKTVLYIEDNLVNLQLVEVLLADRQNVTLMSAMQGSTGIDLALEHAPDVILLDLHLPDIGGDEVLKRLRSSPATAFIPIIMISADATPGQIDRLMNAGATNYLTKPINVKELMQALEKSF